MWNLVKLFKSFHVDLFIGQWPTKILAKETTSSKPIIPKCSRNSKSLTNFHVDLFAGHTYRWMLIVEFSRNSNVFCQMSQSEQCTFYFNHITKYLYFPLNILCCNLEEIGRISSFTCIWYTLSKFIGTFL